MPKAVSDRLNVHRAKRLPAASNLLRSTEQLDSDVINARQLLKLVPSNDTQIRPRGLSPSAVALGVASDPIAERRQRLTRWRTKPKEGPKLQSAGVEDDPHHASTWLFRQVYMHCHAARACIAVT